jgi:cytochrome c oxidase subunit I
VKWHGRHSPTPLSRWPGSGLPNAPHPGNSHPTRSMPVAEAQLEHRLTELWETPKSLYGWLATVDHKELGIRYIVTAFVFLIIGGVEALIMRLQLAHANLHVLSPEIYDQLFTMHGVTMIYWYAQPVLSGFAIFLIPLMIGARDMAFPRFNAFTYWTFLFSGIFLYISPFVGGAPHAGWFAYANYTLKPYSPGFGMDFYALSLIFLTVSSTGAAINFIVTILRLRAPGMAVSRMPLFLYSTLTASFDIIFGLPALSAACIFLELDRNWGTHFFTITKGGTIFLWQQLFWFFGHPWVYVVFLPATGMISLIIPVFSRRPIVGFSYIAISTVLTGLVGFGVWLHHMFTVGMSDIAMSVFSAGSMTISVFTVVQVFAWLATVWRGKPVRTTAMYFAVASIILLVVGGLSGVFTGIIPVDWQVHNTYYVVAHLHYVLVGSNLFPVFAGLYYWFPKMSGRMLSEAWGKASFWVMFAGFNMAFFPMHILGLMGMTRRIFTYVGGLGFSGWNLEITVGAFVLGVGILLTLINVWKSLVSGRIAGPDPWNADGLEWLTASPPEPYNFAHIPTVASRHPLWDNFDELDDPDDDRALDGGRLTPITTWLDSIPKGIATIPEETLAPLIISLFVLGIFIFFVFGMLWWVLITMIGAYLTGCWWNWPRTRKEVL